MYTYSFNFFQPTNTLSQLYLSHTLASFFSIEFVSCKMSKTKSNPKNFTKSIHSVFEIFVKHSSTFKWIFKPKIYSIRNNVYVDIIQMVRFFFHAVWVLNSSKQEKKKKRERERKRRRWKKKNKTTTAIELIFQTKYSTNECFKHFRIESFQWNHVNIECAVRRVIQSTEFPEKSERAAIAAATATQATVATACYTL